MRQHAAGVGRDRTHPAKYDHVIQRVWVVPGQSLIIDAVERPALWMKGSIPRRALTQMQPDVALAGSPRCAASRSQAPEKPG